MSKAAATVAFDRWPATSAVTHHVLWWAGPPWSVWWVGGTSFNHVTDGCWACKRWDKFNWLRDTCVLCNVGVSFWWLVDCVQPQHGGLDRCCIFLWSSVLLTWPQSKFYKAVCATLATTMSDIAVGCKPYPSVLNTVFVWQLYRAKCM